MFYILLKLCLHTRFTFFYISRKIYFFFIKKKGNGQWGSRAVINAQIYCIKMLQLIHCMHVCISASIRAICSMNRSLFMRMYVHKAQNLGLLLSSIAIPECNSNYCVGRKCPHQLQSWVESKIQAAIRRKMKQALNTSQLVKSYLGKSVIKQARKIRINNVNLKNKK